jgi:hypothetical protein
MEQVLSPNLGSVIPGRHRTSAIADVRYVPISGIPEIGCGEPGIHIPSAVVMDSGFAQERAPE